MISMFGVIHFIKRDTLVNNASDEVNLATIKILNNLQNTKYRLEEIVLALASVSSDLSAESEKKETIRNILGANNSGLVVSGGVWFEPYIVDKQKNKLIYFFDRTTDNKFSLIEDYAQSSPVPYRLTEFYLVATYLKKGETYWTKVYKEPVTQKHMITVVAPIYSEDSFIGVATLDVLISEYDEKIFGAFKYPNRYLLMIDREGSIITKSKLLSKFSDAQKLYHNNCKNFAKEFVGIKSIFDNCRLSEEYNKTVAHLLSSKSPEIGMDEGKRVSSSLLKKRDYNNSAIYEKINFVEDDPILQKDSVVAVFYFPQTDWKIIIGIPKDQVLNKSNALYQKIINISIFLTLLTTIVGYFLLKNLFINPIEHINQQLIYNSTHNENHNALLHCQDKGEIGILVDSLNRRTAALVESQNREASETKRRIVNEKLLEQQSKLAAMGGMMDAVAHQWKQPLNALSMYSELIKIDFENASVDEEYIKKFRDDIQLQIRHMLNTLDEFRTFFRPSKEEENFLLTDVINSVLFLTKDEFLKNSITVKMVEDNEIEIYGFKNEFKHLILNIINNSKDAFIENNIKNREISFTLINDTKSKRLKIQDNAGGIPKNIIDDIFKANVTSKAAGKGTGIGLFMSMQIAQKHGATISVYNEKDGACFVVEF